MNTKINSISKGLLALSAIAFLLMYVALSFYNRPANEDVVFVSFIKNRNLIETTSWIYTNWTGRWASTIYFYTIMSASKSFQNIHYVFFIYHCFTFLLLLYAVHSILKTIVSKLFETVIDSKTVFVFSILFIAGFYFSTFQNVEAWWWIYATVDHLQGIVFLLLGISFILKEHKKPIHYLLIALSFIYLGGSYEVYTLIIFASFFFIFVYLKFIRKISLKELYFFKALLTAFISMSLAAFICFIAPGNLKRRSAYNQQTSTSIIQNTDCSIGFSHLVQKKSVLAFGISALFFLLGNKLKNNSGKTIESKKIKNVLLFSGFLFLTSFIVTYAFQILVLRDYSIPERGWTFTSLSLFTFCCTLFLCAGYSIKNKTNSILNIASICIPLLVLIVVSSYLYRQYNFTHVYAKQYDALIEQLIQAKENKELKTLEVNRLSESGMLMPFEIGTAYIDEPITDILELHYEIKLKE